MAATNCVCPTCGARLMPEPSLPDATAGESTWFGRCENQHWWMQSLVFGWISIDPGVTAGAEMTTLEGAGPS
jgi:hypothetical protein